eukprot:3748711-Rhodomonas_salina.1
MPASLQSLSPSPRARLRLGLLPLVTVRRLSRSRSRSRSPRPLLLSSRGLLVAPFKFRVPGPGLGLLPSHTASVGSEFSA